MGAIWLAIGLIYPIASGRPLEMSGLISLGLVFIIAGLANRSKWKKKPELLIGTPGRVLELITAKKIKTPNIKNLFETTQESIIGRQAA